MKTKKVALLLIALVVPLALLGIMGSRYLQQVEAQGQLSAEVAVARQRLASLQAERIASPENGLEKELNDALAQLEEARNTLSQPVSSIAVTDRLFQIADASGVTIRRINETGLTPSVLNKIKSLDISLSVTAEGSLLSMIDFVKKMNKDNVTGVVESVLITLNEDNTSDNSVKLDFVLYSYNGE
ncbi:hypothetical protein ACFLXC_03425 [Chloroflexota bacterium]